MVVSLSSTGNLDRKEDNFSWTLGVHRDDETVHITLGIYLVLQRRNEIMIFFSVHKFGSILQMLHLKGKTEEISWKAKKSAKFY